MTLPIRQWVFHLILTLAIFWLVPFSVKAADPIGYLERIDNNLVVHGWAWDADSPTTSLTLHLYISNVDNSDKTYVGAVKCSISRLDVNEKVGATGLFGWRYVIPAPYNNLVGHRKLFAYAINSGEGTVNPQLTHSPMVYGPTYYKGNTHTHTNESDGDSTPSAVADWYRTHSYDFLVITDHFNRAIPPQINHDNVSTPTFLMINGSELNDNQSQHVTAFALTESLSGTSFTSYQQMIDATIAHHGIPFINHPRWSYRYNSTIAQNILNTSGVFHMEIANMMVATITFKTNPEEAYTYDAARWDDVLSTGRRLYGIASDDMHQLQRDPGKGWIMVKAESLATTPILNAITSGNFYASNGVVLYDPVIDSLKKTFSVYSQNGTKIEFIGRKGAILSTVAAPQATYTFTGNELYVRAKITGAAGQYAWTQPVFYSDINIPTPTLTINPPPPTEDLDLDGDVDALDFYLALSSQFFQSIFTFNQFVPHYGL